MAFNSSGHSANNWSGPGPVQGGYGGLGDPYFTSNNSFATYGPPMQNRSLPLDSMQRVLSEAETIDLFHNAMYTAREEQVPEGKGPEEALRGKTLTLDFKRAGLGSMPEEAVDIIKRDVAMYASKNPKHPNNAAVLSRMTTVLTSNRIVLSHNHLTELPLGFSDCAKITYLNLRANAFETFPESLLQLQLLQILDLSRNRLDVIPDEISKMKALRVLSVSNNLLNTLPHSLGEMDSLKILKLSGNPWNESIVNLLKTEENAASSQVPVAEHENEARITSQVKKFLRTEAESMDSGGESSSESPVDTPRPFKRSASHRFPVNPATTSRSKSPGPSKPALPNKSQFREQRDNAQPVNSRQHSASSSTGTADRTRPNGDTQSQSSQNPRSRRMGMLHKQSPVGTLDDSAANRNSLHLRGTSHNSALKEKQRQHTRHISGTGSNSSMDLDRSQGNNIFRRLSSLPEQRVPITTVNPAIEGAKSLLFALHSLHPYMSSLLHLASADGSRRSSLERVFYNSSSQLDALDQSLQALDQSPPSDEYQRKQQIQNIQRACKACLVAYAQVGQQLIKNAQHLVINADPRYLRMLLILIYGSTIEAGNAFQTMSKPSEGRVGHQKPQFLADSLTNIVPKLTVPSIGPGHERSLTSGPRPRQEALAKDRPSTAEPNAQHEKSASQPSQPSQPPFLPTRTNGRSQGNVRAGGFNQLSSANTPRSGESFYMPSTPIFATPDFQGQSRVEDPQDVLFEKVLVSFQTFVNEAEKVFERATMDLDRRLDRARNNNENKSRIELWTRLAGHAHATLALCQSLSEELGDLHSGGRAVRGSVEFWQRVVKPGLSFADFCSQVKQATNSYRGELVLIETFKAVKPCLRLLKAASTNLELSPWKNATTQSPTSFNQSLSVQTQWPPGAAPSNSPQQKLNGHHRAKNGSGSGSSPYLPTTPLSAALGPAAAATGPSSGTGSFDRSFQGDVFQRAAYALNIGGQNAFRRGG